MKDAKEATDTSPSAPASLTPSLTPKQEMFCQEYLKDLNGTQAAIRAGYSKANADKIASQLLGLSRVSIRVEELKSSRIQRVKVEQDDVLRELLILMKSNITDYQRGENGEIKLAPDASPEALRAVSSVKFKKRTWEGKGGTSVDEETELRLWPKDRAVEMAMKHLGLMVDRVRLEDPDEILAGLLGVKKEELPE